MTKVVAFGAARYGTDPASVPEPSGNVDEPWREPPPSDYGGGGGGGGSTQTTDPRFAYAANNAGSYQFHQAQPQPQQPTVLIPDQTPVPTPQVPTAPDTGAPVVPIACPAGFSFNGYACVPTSEPSGYPTPQAGCPTPPAGYMNAPWGGCAVYPRWWFWLGGGALAAGTLALILRAIGRRRAV